MIPLITPELYIDNTLELKKRRERGREGGRQREKEGDREGDKKRDRGGMKEMEGEREREHYTVYMYRFNITW